MIVLATAHPGKFADAVGTATGAAVPVPATIGRLEAKAERFDRLPADLETVKAYVRAAAA
jgi:threonine synthase